jgi:uncharacterized membrane protein
MAENLNQDNLEIQEKFYFATASSLYIIQIAILLIFATFSQMMYFGIGIFGVQALLFGILFFNDSRRRKSGKKSLFITPSHPQIEPTLSQNLNMHRLGTFVSFTAFFISAVFFLSFTQMLFAIVGFVILIPTVAFIRALYGNWKRNK